MSGSLVVYEVYDNNSNKMIFTGTAGNVCAFLGLTPVTLYRMKKKQREGLYVPYTFKDITDTLKYTVLHKGRPFFKGTRQQVLEQLDISIVKFMNCKCSDNRIYAIFLDDDRLKSKGE